MKKKAKQILAQNDWFEWFLSRIGVVARGHFVFTNGRHSEVKILSRILMANPLELKMVAKSIASAFPIEEYKIQTVVSPAVGAIALGNRVAEHVHYTVKFAAAERRDGVLIFSLEFLPFIKNKRVLVVDDTTTTWGTIEELVQAIAQAGGKVVGVGLLYNRSGRRMKGIPTYACVEKPLPDYSEDSCPLCLAGISVNKDKHGLAFLKKHGPRTKNWPANQKK